MEIVSGGAGAHQAPGDGDPADLEVGEFGECPPLSEQGWQIVDEFNRAFAGPDDLIEEVARCTSTTPAHRHIAWRVGAHSEWAWAPHELRGPRRQLVSRSSWSG
jgi:hypothetical protein